MTIREAARRGACRAGLRRMKKLFAEDAELGLRDALQTGCPQDAFFYVYLCPQSEERLMVIRAFIEDCHAEGLVSDDWLRFAFSGETETDLEWPAHAAHALKDWSRTREALEKCRIS